MISLNTTTGTLATNTTSTAAATSAAASSALGQQDFLTLMLAQLKNQDPLQPMENGEFLAQLAQFSTVGGIEKVNDTLASLGDGMRDFRVATAANLLGHQVLVPGNVARAGADGTINGVVDLPEDAKSVVVTFSDANTGNMLHSETYGPQPAGLMGFAWNNLPAGLADARTPVRITVNAATDAGTQQIGPSVFAKVLSARNGADGADMTLQVEDYGALNALEIEAFR